MDECKPLFHGGLQFQTEHHLVPRMPRHKLRKFRNDVVGPDMTDAARHRHVIQRIVNPRFLRIPALFLVASNICLTSFDSACNICLALRCGQALLRQARTDDRQADVLGGQRGGLEHAQGVGQGGEAEPRVCARHQFGGVIDAARVAPTNLRPHGRF